MKEGLTELVFIVDRSGSMGGLEDDTIGGFNAMLKAQKALEGDALVTTVLFYDKYELLHDRIDIKAVAPLTGKDYTVRGSTALLDAVGRTIDKIRNAQEHTAADYRAEKVLFVIITDGMENASREYSAKWVKGRIERQRQKYGWEFYTSAYGIVFIYNKLKENKDGFRSHLSLMTEIRATHEPLCCCPSFTRTTLGTYELI